MRAFVIGGAVLAVICVGAAQIANTRLDQTRIRAAEVSKEAPKSADDRRVVGDNVVAYSTANEALAGARE